MRDVRAHYIRANESARIPERFIVLDTEAVRERNKSGEVQSWSLAVATFITWDKKARIQKETLRFTTPMELWLAVSDFTRIGRRTVLYAHNLNYDLRISQALSLLPKLGWQMRDMRLDGRGSWSKWSRERASLNLCDSASIFPVPLSLLASTFGMSKLPLPDGNNQDRLFARCEQDVNILTTAITAYVTWLRSGVCGNWQMTGASQSWSHWRHSHYTHKILVHSDEEALAAERAAMHSGRCEAWKWGKYSKEAWYEYDWQNSYPRIARDALLPTRLVGTVSAPSSESLATLIRRYAVLADCEVATDSPCVPVQREGRTLWPVGSFNTTLWDPEICLLREADATVRVHRAWLYKREPALKEWAEWILSSLHDKTETVEPWQKLILKHWSRALIGRFGMRYRAWDKYATSEESRICISQTYNMDTKEQSEMLQIGHDIFTLGKESDINDGAPQITGYIMSEARAKLWRATQLVGQSHVSYMDTDSLLVDSAGHRYISTHQHNPLLDGLRTKGRYNRLHIYGPRSYIADSRPVVAGLSRGATNTQGNEWQSEVWRGAKESVRRNEHNVVTIKPTRFNLRYSAIRRHFNSDGSTLPYRLAPGVEHRPSPVPSKRSKKVKGLDYPSVRSQSPPQRVRC